MTTPDDPDTAGVRRRGDEQDSADMPHGSADPWRSSATPARLRTGLATLGPGEQRVARAVFAEPAAVVELSTAELAAASGTSPATVVRACQRLGFRGFQHLRLELTRVTSIPAGFAAVVDLIARARRILLVGNGFSSPSIQDSPLRFTAAGRSVEAPLDFLGQQFSARISQLSQNFSRTRTYCPALCPTMALRAPTAVSTYVGIGWRTGHPDPASSPCCRPISK
ncbi:MurR/RpiR family transcriptional regulator [Rhodococcus sp. T7]|uniref:MurR/RpiR family transcriptional regulator n=1 Tax=Rhodococcus sp. T7 TaxID=627444 RepID=UPI001358ADD7|nr:hypothetical protein [Rhodococcus sp. T7]KAF0964355.1 hypothetical protein MLGJGCBP_02429 [Rhodococcus sp. T7]